MLSIIFASLAGINRIKRIANTQDPLIKVSLGLKDAINENAISTMLKKVGQKGARLLQSFLIKNNSNSLTNSSLIEMTLGVDSTVSMVYGNQQVAELGYNTVKKGAKSQLLAGKTLTDDFWANDILWQLNCYSYNISVSLRGNHKKFRKQEHKTFRDWFILIPAKLVSSEHKIQLKIYENYYCKSNWIEFDESLNAV